MSFEDGAPNEGLTGNLNEWDTRDLIRNEEGNGIRWDSSGEV